MKRSLTDRHGNGTLRYDVCPGCGELKARKAKLCLECRGKARYIDRVPPPKPLNRLGSAGKKRYHTFSVSGFQIQPESGRTASGGNHPQTTWCVLDAHNCWREVAIFEPTKTTTADCKRRAEELCRRLNREEAKAA